MRATDLCGVWASPVAVPRFASFFRDVVGMCTDPDTVGDAKRQKNSDPRVLEVQR
jgi:hypothetical protein